MKALLSYDLTTKALTDGTSSWQPPVLTFGESLTIGLRFQETLSGSQITATPTIQSLKVASGSVDARPVAGAWKLKIGPAPQSAANTTAALPHNVSPQALQAAINALPAIVTEYGAAVVLALNGGYLIRFGAGAVDVPLALVESQLYPPCFEQVNAWQVAGAWEAELRLCQAPVMFTDGSERVLPPPPSITRIQAGGSDGDFKWNEIQQLTMPPEFLGSYQFKRNNVRTALLSQSDDMDAIAAALARYGSGIAVTLPRDANARIEFGGDFAGTPQELLEVLVADAPEGDLTFTLALDHAPLAAMLRVQDAVTLPLEIELGIADDSLPGGVRIDKIRTAITVQRGVIFPMLATAAGINWLRPVPRDYVPFTTDQVITGQQFYACALGDGEAREFTVDHNLATDNIAAVLLRENSGEGRMLVLGTDYSVTYGGPNSLTITLLNTTTAPATAGLGLVITAAGMVAVFQAHTHTIEQVVGLSDVLDNVRQRLETLEAYLPTTQPTTVTSTTGLTIKIPATAEVLFYNAPTLDLKALPVRAPFLLPAVHAAAAIDLPTPLPAPTLNGVWSAASRTLIPGTARITASYADAAGHVASDGRMLYPANQAAGTTSYYPAPFERTLFEFPINDAQLQVGRTLDVQFGIAAQLLHATCEAQWVAVIEWGIPTDQSAPANEGPNLETIAWSPTPLLAQRIYLTPLLMLHSFGCRIKRNADGLTADAMRYGGWKTAADAAPTSANFVLRARLIKFDTKNNVPNADGWLYYAIGSAIDSKTDAIATIA